MAGSYDISEHWNSSSIGSEVCEKDRNDKGWKIERSLVETDCTREGTSLACSMCEMQ